MDDRITEQNLCFNENLIKECMEEFVKVQNKNKYFSDIVNDRFIACNNLYMEDFDKAIDNLYNKISDNTFKLSRLPAILSKLDKMSKSIYKTQLTIYRIL